MTKNRILNIAVAIFFIFWLCTIFSIIKPFQPDVIVFPQIARNYYDIYKLIIFSSLLSIIMFYRGYKILNNTSQIKCIKVEKNNKQQNKFFITILISTMIMVPVVYAYVYEQNNNNFTQTIIDQALMDEDFDDVPPGSDPPGWSENSGNWTAYDDGGGNIVYYQDDITPKEALSISTTGNTSWANYTFTVDVKFIEGDPSKNDRAALLVYRYTGGNDYYFLAIREAQDQLEVYKHGTAGGGHLVGSASCTLVQDTWYHVNITIIGNNVWISIDSTPYFTNLDMLGTHSSGSVGIGTEYYKVMFDNIYVDEL